MERENIFTIVFMIILIGVLFFWIYSVYITPGGRVITYLLSAVLLLFVVAKDAGDMFPFRRGPLFVTMSGMSGTQVGSPQPQHGGLMTYHVAFRRGDVPDHVKQERNGWMTVFMDMVCGTYTHQITEKSWKFIDVPIFDIENKKISSMVIFHGRIDGGELMDTRDMFSFRKKLESQSKIISYTFTELEGLEKTLAGWAQMKTKDMEVMSQMMQGIADRVKRINIISKGGSGVESIKEGMEN